MICEPIDGVPTVPGHYLCTYTPRQGEPRPELREVRIDGAGCLDHGPDSARVVWCYRVALSALGGDFWTLCSMAPVDLVRLLDERDALRAEVAAVRLALGDPMGPLPDVARAILAARDALRAEARWVPVSEREPTVGADVLVYSVHHGPMMATYGPDISRCVFFGHGRPPGEVTHWRPLPAGPGDDL